MNAVSVIVPAYRTTAYIAEALDSAFSQTVPPAEVIVINDGCPDTANLERALAPFANRISYVVQKNTGPGGARNRGIEMARNPLVAMLDSDDIWEPQYLEENLAVFQKMPETDVVYPNVSYLGIDEPRTYMDIFPSEGPVTWDSVLERRCNVVAFVTAKRDSLIRAGLYDSSLAVGEDLALWLRLLHAGGRIVYHRRPLVRYRVRPSSQTGASRTRNHEQLISMLKDLDAELTLSPLQRRSLRARVSLEQAHLALERGREEIGAGNYRAARSLFREANRVLKKKKLTLISAGLRCAPGLVRWLASRR